MMTIGRWLLLLGMLGGFGYFWHKAMLTSMHWGEILICCVIWPVASIRGIYFLVTDVYRYYKSK